MSPRFPVRLSPAKFPALTMLRPREASRPVRLSCSDGGSARSPLPLAQPPFDLPIRVARQTTGLPFSLPMNLISPARPWKTSDIVEGLTAIHPLLRERAGVRGNRPHLLIAHVRNDIHARPGRVAPIGNRLYRRLAAGLAAGVTRQDTNPSNRAKKNHKEEFSLTPGKRGARFQGLPKPRY